MFWKTLFWLYRIFFLLWGSLGILAAGSVVLSMDQFFMGKSGPMDTIGWIMFAGFMFMGFGFFSCGMFLRSLLYKRTWILFLIPALYFLGLLWLGFDTGGGSFTIGILGLELLFLGGLYYLRVRRPQDGW